MWVFDGEEWVNEGASEARPATTPHHAELDSDAAPFYPELQIVRIVPTTWKQEQIIVPFTIP